MAVPHLDLNLPPSQPKLTGVLGLADCTGASFAIYNLIDVVTDARLKEVAVILQEEWRIATSTLNASSPPFPLPVSPTNL
jgi:hypothetical protein